MYNEEIKRRIEKAKTAEGKKYWFMRLFDITTLKSKQRWIVKFPGENRHEKRKRLSLKRRGKIVENEQS